MRSIIIPFLCILLAEVGDKTQLVILCLASKTRRIWSLWCGCILGFVIVDGLAIILGDYLGKRIPDGVIKILAGLCFLALGLFLLWNSKKDDDGFKEGNSLRHPFGIGLITIFFSEMGDKTQLASGLFSTQYPPLAVFIGVIMALGLLSGLTLWLGKRMSDKIKPSILSRFAGLIFTLIGLISFL